LISYFVLRVDITSYWCIVFKSSQLMCNYTINQLNYTFDLFFLMTFKPKSKWISIACYRRCLSTTVLEHKVTDTIASLYRSRQPCYSCPAAYNRNRITIVSIESKIALHLENYDQNSSNYIYPISN